MRYVSMMSFAGNVERMFEFIVLLLLVAFGASQASEPRYGVADVYERQTAAAAAEEPKLAYLMPLRMEIGSTNLANEQRADLRDALVDAVFQKWLEDTEAGVGAGSGPLEKRERDTQLAEATAEDLNSHLSPMSPFGELTQANRVLANGGQLNEYQLRAPVNDPEEFESRLSELTNALNHKMSNSLARQQLLMQLLNGSSPEAPTSMLPGSRRADSAGELSENLLARLERLLESREERDAKLLVGAPTDLDDAQGNEEEEQEQEQEQDSELISSSTSGAEADEAATSEYIDHPLALFGHQLVQGGAGEGRQLLGPEGTFENIQVIKSDSAIPSYCDPPNPCPLGYTAADGCIENFVNSASFSREYQAKQKCSCDNEHSLFNCASPISASSEQQQQQGEDQSVQEDSTESQQSDNEVDLNGPMAKLDTLARTIQNRFGNLASVRKLISEQQQQQAGDLFEAHNDNSDSNYLARSARKWSPELNYHKMELD